MTPRLTCAVLTLALLLPTACGTEPTTLGEDVTSALCVRMTEDTRRWRATCRGERDLPDDAPADVRTLIARRGELAAAIDTIFPADSEEDLAEMIHGLRPRDPDATTLSIYARQTHHAQAFAAVLADVRAEGEAMDGLARRTARRGYRPASEDLGLWATLVSYPELSAWAATSGRSLVSGALRDPVIELHRAIALEWAAPEVAPTDEPTTLDVTRNLLLTEDDAFGGRDARWMVARDARGIALPRELSTPFVDGDGDGLADVDALERFIGADGTPLELPAPFSVSGEGEVARDADGLALAASGRPLYAYVDASRTPLGVATDLLHPYLSPERPALLELASGLGVWLGPPTSLSRTYGAHDHVYLGYDPASAPALELVATAGELATRQSTRDSLRLAEAMWRTHPSETTALVRAWLALDAEVDHTEAALTAQSLFWDDMSTDVIDLVADDVIDPWLRAAADPRSEGLGESLGAMMRHGDRITYDPNDPNGPPIGLPFDEGVNRAGPDTADHRSVLHRSLALLDGTNGLELCNRDGAVLSLQVESGGSTTPLTYPLFGTANECEILRISNLTEAYAKAAHGTYDLEFGAGFLAAMVTTADALGISLDEALEQSFGIDGLTRRPTPEALTRLVFWGLADETGVQSCVPDADGGNCNSPAAGQLLAPVVDRHGHAVIEQYHGTAFAWEHVGFYDALGPSLETLHTPAGLLNSEGDYRLGALIHTAYTHWESPESTESCGPAACPPTDATFAEQSDLRSFEEALAVGLVNEDLGGRLAAVLATLATLEPATGVDGVRTVADATAELVDPARNTGFTDRAGLTEATVHDGSAMVPMTPYYALLGASRRADEAWQGQPTREDRFRAGRRTVLDGLLSSQFVADEWQFTDPRVHRLGEILLLHSIDRINAQTDLEAWAAGLDDRAAEAITAPSPTAMVRLIDELADDPATLAETSGVLAHLAEDPALLHALSEALSGQADQALRATRTGFATALGPEVSNALDGSAQDVDAENSLLFQTLALAQDLPGTPREDVLYNALARAVTSDEDGTAPVETLVSVLREVQRTSPGTEAVLEPDDHARVLEALQTFVEGDGVGVALLERVLYDRGW